MEFLSRLKEEFWEVFDEHKNNILDENTPDFVWKKILTEEQYHVLREKGTEPPNEGEFVKTFEKGSYYCVACKNKLYSSDSKFRSKSGWASFYQEIDGSINTSLDTSGGRTRVEMHCSQCEGHLGHIFRGENPYKPEEERHCVNSVCLQFVKE